MLVYQSVHRLGWSCKYNLMASWCFVLALLCITIFWWIFWKRFQTKKSQEFSTFPCALETTNDWWLSFSYSDLIDVPRLLSLLCLICRRVKPFLLPFAPYGPTHLPLVLREMFWKSVGSESIQEGRCFQRFSWRCNLTKISLPKFVSISYLGATSKMVGFPNKPTGFPTKMIHFGVEIGVPPPF